MLNIGGGLPRWLVLGSLAVGGLVLVFFGQFAAPPWSVVVEETGVASLIAAILGFTIDRWFKADFVRDVFYAVVGHLVPEAFRDEIRKIATTQFICDDHFLNVEVEKLQTDVVRVTTTIERTLRNIGPAASKKAYLHADEWGFTERTQIIECQMMLEDGTKLKARDIQQTDSTIKFESKDHTIPRGGTVKMFSKMTEIRRLNDVAYFHFTTPTINPEIQIRVSDGLESSCGFGPTEPKVETSRYAPRHKLDGTYFPGQSMSVRWWPKAVSLTSGP